jgi:hypothetical protein
MKETAANPTLKSNSPDSGGSSDTALDARRSGLANHKGSPAQLAGAAAKAGQMQAFAAGNLANAGLRASPSALNADGIKEKDQVNKLR